MKTKAFFILLAMCCLSSCKLSYYSSFPNKVIVADSCGNVYELNRTYGNIYKANKVSKTLPCIK